MQAMDAARETTVQSSEPEAQSDQKILEAAVIVNARRFELGLSTVKFIKKESTLVLETLKLSFEIQIKT